ncbi:hypothetical protein CANARDRAFT_27239 [[Candida] arabinofermentans NRRL YB-2248]|uniref:Uncharacterized protein n=1 Tax=[Candida] arabinofermentans NRRL YB-2248 TaxID=983967 RepID=A0A1E4T537_9ASCO|nr:hypothetical protein CANARDRAFT_27239 [[Candida] arabinofermentans NRRL YB-2248]
MKFSTLLTIFATCITASNALVTFDKRYYNLTEEDIGEQIPFELYITSKDPLIDRLTPIAVNENPGMDYLYLLPMSLNKTNMELTYNPATKTISSLKTQSEFIILGDFATLTEGSSFQSMTFADPTLMETRNLTNNELKELNKNYNWRKYGGRTIVRDYHVGNFYACKDTHDHEGYSKGIYGLMYYSDNEAAPNSCIEVMLMANFS